jgi:pilus assembly protein CpaB
MRRSTLISLVLAAIMAVVAVIGARFYLAGELARITAANTRKDFITETLVVAADSMRFGQRLRAENMKLIKWPSADLPEGAFAKIKDVLPEEGDVRYAMAAIDKGEPVLRSKISGAGERATLSSALAEGMKAISIRVTAVLGVAGFVRPADRVDILLTRSGKSGRGSAGSTFVDVLLQGVKVLAVDQIADERKDEPSVVKTVTFEVTTAEAQRLTLAAKIGTLSLALRNVASAEVEKTRPVTVADLGGGPMAETLRSQVDEDRLKDLEKLVRKVGDDMDARIESVESEIARRPEPAAIVAPRPAPAPAPKTVAKEPEFRNIGVWNTTKRVVHRVRIYEK